MTSTAWLLLALTGVFAVGDWIAVVRKLQTVIYVCKPATLVCLIGVALAIDPSHGPERKWFVAALVLSLIGDVFLMLPQDVFIPGLVSFLFGHITYIVGLTQVHDSWGLTGLGVIVVVAALLLVGRRVINGVRTGEQSAMLGPVVAYMTVISVMVVSAFGSGAAWAIGGALLFYASDATIAWNRFLEVRKWGELAIITTYHLAQVGLVLGLLA